MNPQRRAYRAHGAGSTEVLNWYQKAATTHKSVFSGVAWAVGRPYCIPEFGSVPPGPCWARAVGPFGTHGAGPFGARGLLGGLNLGRPFWDLRQGPYRARGPHGLRGVLNRNYKTATIQRIVEGGVRTLVSQTWTDPLHNKLQTI